MEHKRKLVLASIPRSGSTWLFRSILGMEHGSTTPKDNRFDVGGVGIPYVEKEGWMVCKTHLPFHWWQDVLTDKDRCIFLFGDVVESVISTYLKRFEKNHFKQCGYFGDFKDIFKEDFLGYEEIFDTWMRADVNKFVTKYEEFDFSGVKKFVPFDFLFNEFKYRSTNKHKIFDSQMMDLLDTYQSLISKASNSTCLENS